MKARDGEEEGRREHGNPNRLDGDAGESVTLRTFSAQPIFYFILIICLVKLSETNLTCSLNIPLLLMGWINKPKSSTAQP